MLLHHLGRKENLPVQLLNAIRDRLRAVAAEATAQAGPQGTLDAVWR